MARTIAGVEARTMSRHRSPRPLVRLSMLSLVVSAFGITAACGGDDAAPTAATDVDAGTDAPAPAQTDAGDAMAPDSGDSASDGAPRPITVSGTVVDAKDTAVSGVAVIIKGHDPVVTDSAGEFTIADVVPPYDVVLVSTALSVGVLYQGLARPDPWLTVVEKASAPRTALVKGTIAAGASAFATPNPADTSTTVALRMKNATGLTTSGPSEAATPYTLLNVTWLGAATRTANVHAFQVVMSGTVASSFVAYGSAQVTVTDGVEATADPITMSAATTQDLSGTVTYGGQGTLAAVSSGINVSSGSVGFSQDTSGSATFNHKVPGGVLGATGYAAAVAVDGAGFVGACRRGLSIPASGVNIALPSDAPPEPVSPADGATNIGPGSILRWKGGTNRVHLVTFYAAGEMQFDAFTVADQVTLPDLTAYGLPIPKSAIYSWSVATVFGMTPDEVATPGFMDGLNDVSFGCSRELKVALGPARSVTTRP